MQIKRFVQQAKLCEFFVWWGEISTLVSLRPRPGYTALENFQRSCYCTCSKMTVFTRLTYVQYTKNFALC